MSYAAVHAVTRDQGELVPPLLAVECGGEGTCIYVCFMVELKILFFAQKFTNVWISAKIQIVFVSLIYPKTGFVEFLKIQQTTFLTSL